MTQLSRRKGEKMSYTVNSEYCNFGRDMTTDSWLTYMYRLTGLEKYQSRKRYKAYLEKQI